LKKRIAKGFLTTLVWLESGVLLFVFALYILSDPQTLKYAVDRATSGLSIKYDNISGNFLKTITITNLRYHDQPLAQVAEIDWNLRALVSGKIEIETLSLKHVNLNNIEAIIKHTQQKKESKKKSTKISIPQMSISHLFLSTLPYKSDIINIDSLTLEVYDVASDLEHLSIKEFSLDTQNDHGLLQADGNVQEKELHLNNLTLVKLDIDKILQTITKLENNKENKQSTPFTMIEKMRIDHFYADILPFHHKPYNIESFSMMANDINSSLPNKTIDSDYIQVHSQTNLANIYLEGHLAKNRFKGKSTLNLAEKYFQKFTPLVDFKSVNPIKLTLDANETQVDTNITLKSKQIFTGRYKNYPVSINHLSSQVHYDFQTNVLKAHTDANVSSKYASNLILKDTLTYDGNLSFGGQIDIAGLQHFPEYSLALFDNAKILYKGNEKALVANLKTDKLHLLYEMFDYNSADFKLDSKELEIAKYFPKIPKVFHPLKAKLAAHMFLDFHDTKNIFIDTNITSNALDIKGITSIKKGKVLAKTKTTLSKKSFLVDIDKNLKVAKLFPANLDIAYEDQNLSLDLKAKNDLLTNHFSYDLNNTFIDEKLLLGGDTITLKGQSEKLQLYTHTYSLKTLQENLLPIYNFKKEPYDGEVELNATIENLATMKANIDSRWLVYEYTLNKFAFAEKVKLSLESNIEQTIIKNYQFNTYLDYDRKFFASKPSIFSYKNNKIKILKLWVNDGLLTKGGYDINAKQGFFHTSAKQYRYKGQEGDITFNANIDTTLSSKRTHIEGNVNITKGLITYEHRKTHDIQDPDIIIIQEEEQRKARAAEKKNDLSLDISIFSKKPLHYKVPKIDVDVTPDIKIWKDPQKEVEMLGRVIINQGTYIESDKEFTILPGEALFGGEILNPYLNIKATHTNNPYVISIDVTGTLDSPIINFSSSPYLSQSDILSMLLFSATTDSLFEGSSNSSNQAISMLGNTFAKEIVKNFGLTLDKLVFSTNEEGGLGVEIGKKISKKITVIYINDIVQSIKVKYQHSDSFETDLMLSPESSGIDFLYKSEH